jgi:predicted nucleotidyltransferase component of viral defense system
MKNMAASVRARLRTKARQRDQTFNEVLQYYGIERLLYRLSRSQYSDNFVLKGALLFFGWGIPLRRPTRDIDFRGYEFSTLEKVEEIFRHICGVRVEEDGLQFDPNSVRAERIIEDETYAGVRVRFQGQLEKAVLHMQVDIGFSDQLATGPTWVDYPTILDMPSPRIRVYPLESFISEKFEALMSLGVANSRLKDFYDLYVASNVFELEGEPLAEAIATTFRSRNTPIPEGVPDGLSDVFVDNRSRQWRA